MSSLRLDGQDVSPPEREGEEGDVLTEMDRQTEDFLGWGKETILSERQVVEKEENKNKETAFLVTRTDRQTLAFVVVGLIVSTKLARLLQDLIIVKTKLKRIFLGDLHIFQVGIILSGILYHAIAMADKPSYCSSRL